jgi:hypothetical protein
MVVRAER